MNFSIKFLWVSFCLGLLCISVTAGYYRNKAQISPEKPLEKFVANVTDFSVTLDSEVPCDVSLYTGSSNSTKKLVQRDSECFICTVTHKTPRGFTVENIWLVVRCSRPSVVAYSYYYYSDVATAYMLLYMAYGVLFFFFLMMMEILGHILFKKSVTIVALNKIENLMGVRGPHSVANMEETTLAEDCSEEEGHPSIISHLTQQFESRYGDKTE